jgi:hypothetical protein
MNYNIHNKEWEWNNPTLEVGEIYRLYLNLTNLKDVVYVFRNSKPSEMSNWCVYRIDPLTKVITHKLAVKEACRLVKLNEL